MSDSAAILATFHDWRTVKGRKQLQLIFEVDLERQEEVLTALGAPMPSLPKWVAIALLDKKLLEGQGANAPVLSKPVPTKDRRNWNELPPATQAGIRCGEPAFQRFLQEIDQLSWKTAWLRTSDPTETAADVVRYLCGVTSRSELSGNRSNWDALNDRYDAWMRAAV